MNAEAHRPTPLQKSANPILKWATRVFALFGMFFVLYFIAGLAVDIPSFDETSGGYEYPYAGWTGTPIDYDEWFATADGLYKRGRIIDQYADCETGMLSFTVLGVLSGEFRVFSDRAKVVHQPQRSCRELGFDTSIWDGIDDPQGLFTDLNSD